MDPDALGPVLRERVSNSIVDTVGVAVAGVLQPEFEPVRSFLDGTGTGESGASCIWGDDERVPAAVAAFANGTAGHLLDFDDVHYLIHGHPSTVLLPAVLATAQDVGADGAAVLRGFVAGLGVMAAVARAFGPEHYSRGWHSTSTCGVIGAAAGCAVTRGLDADRVANAIVIAVSMAQGVRANFGTLLKPMHAGFAARSGVEAAALSSYGVDASRTALEGALGGVSLFGDGSWSPAGDDDFALLLRDAAEAPADLGLKLYPCCRGSHYSVDAALEVRAQLPADVAIHRIDVRVPLGTKTALIYDDPTSGLEAKFSLPYTIATSLARGLPVVEHFDDAAIQDVVVRDLMSRMVVEQDESNGDLSSTMEGRYADITVTDAEGRSWRARVDDARGSATRPLTAEDVDAKFRAAVGPVRGRAAADTLLGRLRTLQSERSVRTLFSVA